MEKRQITWQELVALSALQRAFALRQTCRIARNNVISIYN
jgi:hypothetical protein